MSRALYRLIRWTIGADRTPGASPPIREVDCTSCMDKSEATTDQVAGDTWALGHTGETGHTGYREIVTAFLRTRPA